MHGTLRDKHGEVPTEPIMTARDLSFTVNGRRLIDSIDIAIGRGRRTVVMGANGAGKSLLLRLLHGLIRPTSGALLWQGRPLDREARRAQAMVFQRPVMLRRSVLSNLRFALSVRGMRGPERRHREGEALASARLDDLAGQPARLLSGGEQQRLAVARALASNPQILFLDEPTASLDPASTDAVEQLIRDAHAVGVTTVMVTHDVGQAKRIGEDVIFMHAGRVVEQGRLADIIDAPRSKAARAWLEGRLYFEPDTLQDHDRKGDRP